MFEDEWFLKYANKLDHKKRDDFEFKSKADLIELKPKRPKVALRSVINKREDLEDLMTISEVAARLNVHIATVYKWIKLGLLGCQPLGKRDKRVSVNQLQEFLSSLARKY